MISKAEIKKSSKVNFPSTVENVPKSSNLAIPKFMDKYNILNKDIIILGDDYSKIKVKLLSNW